MRDRHLEWFLALVEGDGPYWKRDMDAAWLDRIELEHDNYRAALDHARATGDVERELRLANALRYFWRVRGYVVEGRRRLEVAVEHSDSVDPGLRARTLGEAGIMAFTGGDYERSRVLWTEALPLIEALGDRREIARANFELGAWAHATSDLAEAQRRYESAREALSDVDDPWERDRARQPRDRLPGDGAARTRPRGIRGGARAVREERRPGRARGHHAQHGARRAPERRSPEAARRLGEALAWSRAPWASGGHGVRRRLRLRACARARAPGRRGRALRRVRPDVRADRQRAPARRDRATRTVAGTALERDRRRGADRPVATRCRRTR